MLALSVFTSLFAIVNPVVNIPIFLDLTTAADNAAKKRVAKMAVITAFIILLVFILIGKPLFDFLGITIPAFRITGGILLFYVGFELLSSRKSSIQTNDSGQVQKFDESIAVSPLAIPMLAGPGTIVAAMNYTTNQSLVGMGIIILMLLLVMVITYYAFVFSDRIFKFLGSNIIMVMGKLMGLIVAIIGANMVIEGIKSAGIF